MKREYLKSIIWAAFCLSVISCTGWTEKEHLVIRQEGELMRILSVDDSLDRLVLRSRSRNLGVRELKSADYEFLAARMEKTVSDTSVGGVGLAAPQVGILRRVVSVQRLDKEGEPFETYPNIYITSMDTALVAGPEGCLSVPDRRGTVRRSRNIEIRYTSLHSMRDTVERVKGFTAVIFQHECDHLDGVLYIDKLVEQDPPKENL